MLKYMRGWIFVTDGARITAGEQKSLSVDRLGSLTTKGKSALFVVLSSILIHGGI